MARIDFGFEQRMQHWGAWTLSFANNENGWPDRSSLYNFLREGFSGNENRQRTSSMPYPHNEYAEAVDALVQQLAHANRELAEAVYVYYAVPRRLLNIKAFSARMRIHHSTFYRRLDAAKLWINQRLDD